MKSLPAKTESILQKLYAMEPPGPAPEMIATHQQHVRETRWRLKELINRFKSNKPKLANFRPFEHTPPPLSSISTIRNKTKLSPDEEKERKKDIQDNRRFTILCITVFITIFFSIILHNWLSYM